MSKDKLIPELRFPEFKNEGEWENIKLKQFATFYRGLTYGQDDVADNGLLVLRSGNIQNDTLLLNKDLVYVQKDCPTNLKLLNGDIVICMSNGSKSLVGKNAEYRGEYSGDITVGAFCSIMRPKNRFTKYLLQSDSYQTFIALSIGGGNINNLKNSDLEEFECAAPKKNLEQQKIAATLSSLDDLITAQNEKIKALQAHKKSLMQQLFPAEGERVPRLRFPEFWGAGDWEEKMLGDHEVAIFIKEKISLDKVKLESYVSTENMLPEYSGITTASRLPPTGSLTKFKPADILISNIRPYLKKVWFADKSGAASNDIIIIRSGTAVSENFLSFLLKNDSFISFMMEGAKGLKMPRGDKSLLDTYRINFPNFLEQQKIAATLSSLDDLLKTQNQKLEALKKHKKGLMQQLFPNPNEAN